MINETIEKYINSNGVKTGSILFFDNQIRLEGNMGRVFLTNSKVTELINKIGMLCSSKEVKTVQLIYTEDALHVLVKEDDYNDNYLSIVLSDKKSNNCLYYYRRREKSLYRVLTNTEHLYLKVLEVLLDEAPSLSLLTERNLTGSLKGYTTF